MKKILRGVILVAACISSCAFLAYAQNDPANTADDSGDNKEENYEIARGTITFIDKDSGTVVIALHSTGQLRTFTANPKLLQNLRVGWRVRIKIKKSTGEVIYIKKIRHG